MESTLSFSDNSGAHFVFSVVFEMSEEDRLSVRGSGLLKNRAH